MAVKHVRAYSAPDAADALGKLEQDGEIQVLWSHLEHQQDGRGWAYLDMLVQVTPPVPAVMAATPLEPQAPARRRTAREVMEGRGG